MGDLEVPPPVVPAVSYSNPLTLHQMIKASGEYNFKQCQVTIKSQLNQDAWDELLQGYWDSQLPLLIRFGFPLDFDRTVSLDSHPENHNSAKNYPPDVQAYLEEEKAYNAILDLSFPQGKSVNAGNAQDI